MTSAAVDQLTYEEMKSQAIKYKETGKEAECEVKQLQFESDENHNVFTKEFNKKYRVVFDKRVIVKNGRYQT